MLTYEVNFSFDLKFPLHEWNITAMWMYVNFKQNKVENALTANTNVADNVQLSVSEHM